MLVCYPVHSLKGFPSGSKEAPMECNVTSVPVSKPGDAVVSKLGEAVMSKPGVCGRGAGERRNHKLKGLGPLPPTLY